MAKLIFVIVITVVVVVLAMANAHHIELSLVVGKPVEVRLVFLVSSAYFAGVVSTVLWGMTRRLQKTRELRMMQLVASSESDRNELED